MPFYDYECIACKNKETKIKARMLTSEEDTGEKCEKCGSELKRLLTFGGISCPPHHIKDCDLDD